MTKLTIVVDERVLDLISAFQDARAAVINGDPENQSAFDKFMTEYHRAAVTLASEFEFQTLTAQATPPAPPVESEADALLSKVQKALYPFRNALKYDPDLAKVGDNHAKQTLISFEYEDDSYIIRVSEPDEEEEYLNVHHLHILRVLYNGIDLYLNPIPW
jgi:hypothetical protein